MSEVDLSPELIDEFILGDARGGRRKVAPVQMTMSRELTRADLEALVDGASPANVPAVGSILKIRNAHHQLARHIALGTSSTEISAITGYSPAYISTLKNDPAFKELLQYYEAQREAIFVDTAERAKAVSIAALEELQERIDNEPESFKHRELMELAQLAPGVGGNGNKGAPSSPAGSTDITITFVAPEPAASSLLIDISPKEEE